MPKKLMLWGVHNFCTIDIHSFCPTTYPKRQPARENNLENVITRQKWLNSILKERPWKKKPILQYDKQGNFIREWASVTDFGKSIGKNVGGNINACIRGKQPTAYGYKWKFKQLILGESW